MTTEAYSSHALLNFVHSELEHAFRSINVEDGLKLDSNRRLSTFAYSYIILLTITILAVLLFRLLVMLLYSFVLLLLLLWSSSILSLNLWASCFHILSSFMNLLNVTRLHLTMILIL